MPVSPHQHVNGAVGEGSGRGGAFFGSLASGALLGWLLDLWLGTAPWLVIIGIVLGAYSGFHLAWSALNASEPTVSSLIWWSGSATVGASEEDDVSESADG